VRVYTSAMAPFRNRSTCVCMCERVCKYQVFVLHICVRVRELVCVYVYLRWHHLVIKVCVCVYVSVCVYVLYLCPAHACVRERE